MNLSTIIESISWSNFKDASFASSSLLISGDLCSENMLYVTLPWTEWTLSDLGKSQSVSRIKDGKVYAQISLALSYPNLMYTLMPSPLKLKLDIVNSNLILTWKPITNFNWIVSSVESPLGLGKVGK